MPCVNQLSRDVSMSLFRDFMYQFSGVLRTFDGYINTILRDMMDNYSFSAFALLILVSFAYGVFHSFGPGHGKTLVFSYFLKEKHFLRKSISLAAIISIIHTGSAIILSFLLHFVFTSVRGMFRIKMQGYFMAVSGITVACVGIVFLIMKLINKKKSDNEEIAKGKGLLAVGLSAGIVPCPAALMIMILTLSKDALLIGLFCVFSISLGMFVLLSAIGLLSIKSREGILSVSGRFVKNTENAAEVLEFISIALITLIGVVMAYPFIGLLF